MEDHYDNLLERLNSLTLHKRRRHFDALLLINVFSGTKFCPSVLEIVGLRVPTRNIHNFNNSLAPQATALSDRRVSTANAACKLTHIFFRNSCLSVKILN
jgi:hypothetical protein